MAIWDPEGGICIFCVNDPDPKENPDPIWEIEKYDNIVSPQSIFTLVLVKNIPLLRNLGVDSVNLNPPPSSQPSSPPSSQPNSPCKSSIEKCPKMPVHTGVLFKKGSLPPDLAPSLELRSSFEKDTCMNSFGGKFR